MLDLLHSDVCYVRAYPAAVAEAWVNDHIHAFAFFGAVSRSVLYDNDLWRVERCPPRLDPDCYPYLPKATVEKTRAGPYMRLLSGAAEDAV